MQRSLPLGPLVVGLLCLPLVTGLGRTNAAAPAPADWRPLFDGRALGQWEPTPFGGEGEVTVGDGVLRIAMGVDLSGVTWQGEFPRQEFEIALDARRVEGHDFFCGLTFPVAEDHCSLILGGWGGGVVGLSSIDGEDAANNATTEVVSFDNGRWYAIRVQVTRDRIRCFLDDEPIVDQPLEGHAISVRDEVIPSQPLGIATYATTAELRNIRWRPLPAGNAPAAVSRPATAD
jgi:hypothetical protein